MKEYYVNNCTQNSGDHEVHDETCTYLNSIVSKPLLGNFASFFEAVKEANKTYFTADDCATCSPTCNNG